VRRTEREKERDRETERERERERRKKWKQKVKIGDLASKTGSSDNEIDINRRGWKREIE